MTTTTERYEYVLITYMDEEISKDDCYRFTSEHDNLSLDPYGDNVGFAVGSNQEIYALEDAPYVPEEENEA